MPIPCPGHVMDKTQLQAIISTFEAEHFPYQWGTNHVRYIKHWYISVKSYRCNSSLLFEGRSWHPSPKFSYFNCAGRQQSPLLPSITQACFNLMTTLLTTKINMISAFQSNHSYKTKEPPGLCSVGWSFGLSLTSETSGMTGCISDRWKGIRDPRDPDSFFSLRGAERMPVRSKSSAWHVAPLPLGYWRISVGDDRQAASFLPTVSSWRTQQVLMGTRHYLPYP